MMFKKSGLAKYLFCGAAAAAMSAPVVTKSTPAGAADYKAYRIVLMEKYEEDFDKVGQNWKYSILMPGG